MTSNCGLVHYSGVMGAWYSGGSLRKLCVTCVPEDLMESFPLALEVWIREMRKSLSGSVND